MIIDKCESKLSLVKLDFFALGMQLWPIFLPIIKESISFCSKWPIINYSQSRHILITFYIILADNSQNQYNL